MATAQTNSTSISGPLTGTLSWTYTQYSGACGIEGQSYYHEWVDTNFQLTTNDASVIAANNGSDVVPLYASATYFSSPGGSSCPPSGAMGTSLGPIADNQGDTFTINFTPSGAGGYAQSVLSNVTSQFNPAYQVVSILYNAPGNLSNNGYSDSTSNASTTTIGNSIQNATSLTFTEGFSFFGFFGMSVSETGGYSHTWSNSTESVTSFTNATGLGNSSPGSSSSNAIDHGQDLFVIWMNPVVSVSGPPNTPKFYSMGVQPAADGTAAQPSLIEVAAQAMEANAQGHTLVPSQWLIPQAVGGTLSSPQYGPGLASICKNLNVQEYEAGQCTLADQCGCTPSDFAPILAQDPLVYYSGIQNPLNANNDDSSVCGELPGLPSGFNCRYVPVPDPDNPSIQEFETLSGPDTPGGDLIHNLFQQGENRGSTITQGTQQSESAGVSVGGHSKLGGFKLSVSDTFTWTQQQSTGTSNGSGVNLSVDLCSSTVGCGETVYVYEDTIFHTFVFAGADNSCP